MKAFEKVILILLLTLLVKFYCQVFLLTPVRLLVTNENLLTFSITNRVVEGEI